MAQAPILIIGGAGKTGRRVNALLQARGVPTRGVSRSTPVAFDWTKPEGWAAALDGVSKAYVTFHPDVAVKGASTAIAELSRMARQAGLEHVVLLSGRGEPGAQRAEAALQSSGVPWTIVRSSWFSQNFSEGYAPSAAVTAAATARSVTRSTSRMTAAASTRRCKHNWGQRRMTQTTGW